MALGKPSGTGKTALKSMMMNNGYYKCVTNLFLMFSLNKSSRTISRQACYFDSLDQFV